MDDFIGVKVALLVNDQLVVIQRDNKPGLRFAGLWDFPGGGRENQESIFDCAVREIKEELGITLRPDSIIWQAEFPAMHDPRLTAYFLVANVNEDDVKNIRFGNEGSGWKLMRIDDFMKATDVVEPLKERLQGYLDIRLRHSKLR